MENDFKTEVSYSDVHDFLAKCCGMNAATVSQLPSSVNTVFLCKYQGSQFVTRFLSLARRTQEECEAELSWINYLRSGGISVAAPIAQQDGSLKKLIAIDDRQYVVSNFEKANGRIYRAEEFTPELLISWGKYIARMHNISAGLPTKLKRRNWYEFDYLKSANFSKVGPRLAVECERVVTALHALSYDSQDYGLIHNGLHRNNFCVGADGMTAFDFDEACYGWHFSDIIGPLYYLVRPIEDKKSRSRTFIDALEHVLMGYRSIRDLDDKWIDTIPLFLKYRHFEMIFARSRKQCEKEKEMKELRSYVNDIEGGRDFIEL